MWPLSPAAARRVPAGEKRTVRAGACKDGRDRTSLARVGDTAKR